MSEPMKFDPVPLNPPPTAEPKPIPLPTTEPAAEKPAPKPSKTAWVAEVLKLAAKPTKRKGVAAAGLLSLAAGAGVAKLLFPSKPTPADSQREVAGKGELPPSPLQEQEPPKKPDEQGSEKKPTEQEPDKQPTPQEPEKQPGEQGPIRVPLVNPVVLPAGAGGNTQIELPTPVFAGEQPNTALTAPKLTADTPAPALTAPKLTADPPAPALPAPTLTTGNPSDTLVPPKLEPGGPAVAVNEKPTDPLAAYTYVDRYNLFVGPPERPVAFVEQKEQALPKVVLATNTVPPPPPPTVEVKPQIQQAGGIEPPKIDAPTLPPPPPPAGGGGIAVPTLDLPKIDSQAKPPDPPKVELPKVELPASHSKTEQPKVDLPPKVELPKVDLSNPAQSVQKDATVPAGPPKPIDLPNPTVPPPAFEPAKPVDVKPAPTLPLPTVAPQPPAGTSPAARPAEPPPAALPPVKPAVDPAVTRASANVQTTFDVDVHDVRAGDTFASISKKHLGDDRYAEAIRAFNGGRPLTELVRDGVNIPPIYVLRQQYPNLLGGTPPAGTSPAARPVPGVTKTFLVPMGGMTMKGIARQAFGDETMWPKVWDLNPQLDVKAVLPEGTSVVLPTDSRIGR